jgi:hypothetical protein
VDHPIYYVPTQLTERCPSGGIGSAMQSRKLLSFEKWWQNQWSGDGLYPGRWGIVGILLSSCAGLSKGDRVCGGTQRDV